MSETKQPKWDHIEGHDAQISIFGKKIRLLMESIINRIVIMLNGLSIRDIFIATGSDTGRYINSVYDRFSL